MWAMLVFFGIIPTEVLVPSRVHLFLNGTLYINIFLSTIAWCMMLWTMMRLTTHSLD